MGDSPEWVIFDDDEDFHAKYYRWWTFAAWWDGISIGVKLAPVSITAYEWEPGDWHLEAFWLNRQRLFLVPPIRQLDTL